MIRPETYLGFPLEEAKKLASGEGEAFPDAIYTFSPSKGFMSRRDGNAVVRIIGFRDGKFIVSSFNEFIRSGEDSAG